MSSMQFSGPRHPVGVLLLGAVVIAGAVGLWGRNIGLFMLALLISFVALAGLYAVVRRRLGWRPLDADALNSLPNMPWL